MRKEFITTLETLALKDERIVFLTADLGFMVLESLRDKIPNRFFNVGVCEQNMIGMATGLAQQGLLPFCYSIIPFAVYRPFELIRNACYQNLPIRIIGMGAGFDYETAGYTHFGLEDIGVLRTIPNIHIYSPCDSPQAAFILEQTYDKPVPTYYRLSKDSTDLGIGCAKDYIYEKIRSTDTLYIATGDISDDVLAEAEKENASVLLFGKLHPLSDFPEKLTGYRTIVTFEMHVQHGGLGTIIAEMLAKYSLRITTFDTRAVHLHLSKTFVGTKQQLECAHGLR